MNNELTRWFASQPFFTKWLLVASAVIPLLLKFRIISPHYLVFYWPHIWKSLQIWRPVTSIFISGVNISFIFSLYFRYQYSMYLETLQFAGQPADYLWFMLLVIAMLTGLNVYFGLAVLWEGFSTALVHVWAQYNKAVTVSFMFGLRFPAVYLPGAMALYTLVMGGDVMGVLMGIFVGHLYYFSKEILARRNAKILKVLEAPSFIRRLVGQPGRMAPGSVLTKSEGFTVQAPRNPAVDAGTKNETEAATKFRPFSGSGKKLGSA